MSAQLDLTLTDYLALETLRDAVRECLRDNAPRAMTYSEIRAVIRRGSDTGISARIRELRQKGEPISDALKREGAPRGTYEYRWIEH